MLGETKDYTPPTNEQCLDFIAKKNPTFKVLRDSKFYQIYAHIDQKETGLPHQYIIDGSTMEFVFRTQGTAEEKLALAKIDELLGK